MHLQENVQPSSIQTAILLWFTVKQAPPRLIIEHRTIKLSIETPPQNISYKPTDNPILTQVITY